jgi:hypothetical protein
MISPDPVRISCKIPSDFCLTELVFLFFYKQNCKQKIFQRVVAATHLKHDAAGRKRCGPSKRNFGGFVGGWRGFHFMRLRQDIEIGYEIRSNEHAKRRGGVFSPRKGGGKTNYLLSPQDRNISLETKPMLPKSTPSMEKSKQTISPIYGKPSPTSPARKPPRPTSAPMQRPRTTEFPQRVRKAVLLPPDNTPWDNSTSNLDRGFLLILQDNEISKFRQEVWESPRNTRPETAHIGPSHEHDRKTISTSYSRCRDARTSGPILNISSHHVGFAQKTAERISDKTTTGIHGSRWNVSTKDRDEEPRAKPEIPSDSKSSIKLHETFYSTDVWRDISSRGVIKTQSSSSSPQQINSTWDDVKKVQLSSNARTFPSQKIRKR